jgi:ABC-type glycerol-3-phosphate transport system substrate-binding protein
MQAEQMEQALAQVKWNGYLWGVPKNLDSYVVVYNTKRLSEWGELPPANAEELVQLHKQLHKPEEGKYGLDFAAPDYRSFLTLARILGGAKTASKTAPLELADPNVQRTLELFLFEDARQLSKSFPQQSATWKPWEQLLQGKLAAYLTTFSDWKQNESAAVTMTAIPLPKGEEAWKGPWLSGKSFTISARSQSAKESFDWIRELVSSNAAVRFWSAAGVFPAQTSGYVSSIKNDPAFKNVAAYIDLDDAVPTAPQRARQLTALQGGLEQLWRGELTFKTFLERTTAEWNAIIPSAKP